MIKGKGVPAFDKLRTMFPKEYEFEAWFESVLSEYINH